MNKSLGEQLRSYIKDRQLNIDNSLNDCRYFNTNLHVLDQLAEDKEGVIREGTIVSFIGYNEAPENLMNLIANLAFPVGSVREAIDRKMELDNIPDYVYYKIKEYCEDDTIKLITLDLEWYRINCVDSMVFASLMSMTIKRLITYLAETKTTLFVYDNFRDTSNITTKPIKYLDNSYVRHGSTSIIYLSDTVFLSKQFDDNSIVKSNKLVKVPYKLGISVAPQKTPLDE